ncbi:MBL fold metallo-hydrolase [Anaerosinus massiliensis]|uniref:MBL fold metallo-hydrolase n=1 Tax=Massilibacillus massiliensis TaxID=1806837 RepID=UPI000AB2C5DE|nr:MBL fold metallo-hydrolase [Massilibacillus massiliensis]
MQEAAVSYLLNSGFAVKINRTLLVFDYYLDPENTIPQAIKESDTVYFFSSHRHFDHFNPLIGQFEAQVKQYFLSFDIENEKGAKQIPADKSVYLKAYDSYHHDEIKIKTYSSTDEGISFLVEIAGWSIFHAGDFNWWHWKGDLEENIKFAKNGFMKQLKKMFDLSADIAFFPVDSRMEEFSDLGAGEFCKVTNVKNLIAMHAHGVVWEPKADFFAEGKAIPTWCPVKSGDTRKFNK